MMNSRFNSTLILSLILVCMFAFNQTGDASTGTVSSPEVRVIHPRGVQRGHEHELKFNGVRLADAEEVFLYDKGIEVLEVKAVDDKRVNVKIKVAPDCRLGEHIAQIRTRSGISNYRSFYVGALPRITEKEPNNTLKTADKIEQNVTVSGRIINEDVDYFAVSAKAGDRLSIEIEAIRLGEMFDPFIALLDKNRFELAVSDDTPQFKQDGFISIKVPADGEYYVMVRESSYGGNGRTRYRLHVGNFPRPTIAFPAGGPAGKVTEVTLLGDPMGEIKKQIAVPSNEAFRSGYFYEDESGISPSPVAFRISDFDNVREQTPNGNFDQALKFPPINAPIAINGVISEPGGFDYHLVHFKKDVPYHVECFARRIGSNLDPVMNIFGPGKKGITGDDDARRPDCYVRFTPPADGNYFVRIYDHLRRGQEDFVYRVEITIAKPELTIEIPRVDRFSQKRQTISVAQGNRFATLIKAKRADFAAELKLLETTLPAGVTMSSHPMDAKLDLMPVVFEAAADSEPNGMLVDLVASHVDDSFGLKGRFFNIAEFALGQPNNSRYFASSVDKLAVAVTKKLPFKIDIVQSESPIVRNGAKNIRIVATRDEGFDQPIKIQFPFRPPGISTKPTVVIPKGKNEIDYPLNANGNARIDTWPVYATGWANINGEAWGSTQMATLQIAEPFTTFTIKKAKCVQGESTRLVCKLNHLHPFEGDATAQVLGVPPQVTFPKLTFTKDTKELVFDVNTANDSPIGKHKGLHCRITVPHKGEFVVSVAGRSELQITKPPVVTKAQPKPAAIPASAKPTPTPQPDDAASK